MCECYQIGGRFIAEDPDCPIHGRASEGREERIEAIILQTVAGELSVSDAVYLIDELYR